ncbi:outer membrane beta-barrel protein [Desulfolutivibrio sulfoxidireducens]|uniref:outer membrane beta-barrel protein n=1 Tax=Desulfolutivibrio sulfoxidireducens TaxID=2773299 RepID=UPI00159DF719|nr:outer membrane beta-barrel protein [Desulfolutivibrio sulfoxidireducens]
MTGSIRKLSFVAIALALCLFLAQRPASAADVAAQGTFHLTPEAGIYGAGQKSVNTIFTVGASVGYFVIDGLSLGAEFLYYNINQSDLYDDVVSYYGGSRKFHSTVNGFGTNFLVRYYVVHQDNFALFLGSGIGGLFTDHRAPAWENDKQGNYSNWTVPVDLGVAINLSDTVSLDLTGRYQRIGFTKAGIDAFGGHAGIRISF